MSLFWLFAAGTDPANPSRWNQRSAYHRGIDRATFVERNIVLVLSAAVLSETVLVIE